jgi:sugar lactone lactonase YvrE
MFTVEKYAAAVAEHGEGPVWSETWGGLRFVDMHAGDILSVDDNSGAISRQHVDTVAAAFRPRLSGGMVIAGERDFILADEEGNLRRLGTAFTEPMMRFNEGSCTPDGAFLCGTMDRNKTAGAGRMYRLGVDGEVSVVLSGVSISNGLAFAAAGDLAYYVDSASGRIDAFDYADGILMNRREFVAIDPSFGVPDGLCVDMEGGVWVAMWQGYAVRRYGSDASLTAVVDIPVSQVTACTFGGSDLDELYVTTSRFGRPADENTLAGAVFRVAVGVRGMVPLAFAG